jgi:pilus assembly protein CpaB
MILMVVAIGCGLVASYMTSKLIADRSNNGPPSEEKVVLVVPKKDIGKWNLIKRPEDLFELREYSKANAPKDAIVDLKFLEGKRISSGVREGVPVTERDLLNKDLDGLAAMVRPGSRAVGMRVDAVHSAGGFVLPGYLVDVVCTQTRNDLVSTVILQKMTVLAVDTVAGRDPEKGISIVGSTVTLAALPEETTRLALGAELGKLSLIIRAPGDDGDLTRVPLTRPADLLKPLREGKETDSDDPRGATGTSTSGVLPPVEAAPAEVKHDKPENPEKFVAVEPEKPKVKVHRITFVEGDRQWQEVFVWDDEERTWKKSTSRVMDDEGSRRPAPSPAPTRPADPQTKPADPTAAKPVG